MKPTKNRVMCPDCFRPKMLFESRKKAINFIKFNKDALEYGGETLRAYFCQSCGGWHISHQPGHWTNKLATDREFSENYAQKQLNKMFNKLKRKVNNE